MYTSTTNTSVI